MSQANGTVFKSPFPYGSDFNFVKMQFAASDTDKSGKLDFEEFRRLLPFMGTQLRICCFSASVHDGRNIRTVRLNPVWLVWL